MLVYIDSFSGLIPGKLIGAEMEKGQLYIIAKSTAKVGPYKRGTVFNRMSHHIVPRDRVRGLRSISGARILPVDWAERLKAAGVAIDYPGGA